MMRARCIVVLMVFAVWANGWAQPDVDALRSRIQRSALIAVVTCAEGSGELRLEILADSSDWSEAEILSCARLLMGSGSTLSFQGKSHLCVLGYPSARSNFPSQGTLIPIIEGDVWVSISKNAQVEKVALSEVQAWLKKRVD